MEQLTMNRKHISFDGWKELEDLAGTSKGTDVNGACIFRMIYDESGHKGFGIILFGDKYHIKDASLRHVFKKAMSSGVNFIEINNFSDPSDSEYDFSNEWKKKYDEAAGKGSILLSEALKDACQRFYLLEDGDSGYFEYELIQDYDEGLSDKEAEMILESDDPEEALLSEVEEYYENYVDDLTDDVIKYTSDTLCEKLNILSVEDIPEEYAISGGDIEEYVTEHISFNYDDVIRKIKDQYFHVVVTLGCGEERKDFYKSGDDPVNKEHWPAVYELFRLQGYPDTFDLSKKVENRGKFETSVISEIDNSVSNINAAVILCNIRFSDLIKAKVDRFSGISIKKDAEAGFFDPWSGGGAPLEFEFEKDFILPKEDIFSMKIDGRNSFSRYSVKEVYDLPDSLWKDAEIVF